MNKATSMDDYIESYPDKVQGILQQIRATIKSIVPEAEEAVKYGIPTFVRGKNLVHFGAYKNHIGFYPTPDVITAFQRELSGYETAKGSVQFPVDKPIPFVLIRQMVAFRVAQMNDKKNVATKKKQ